MQELVCSDERFSWFSQFLAFYSQKRHLREKWLLKRIWWGLQSYQIGISPSWICIKEIRKQPLSKRSAVQPCCQLAIDDKTTFSPCKEFLQHATLQSEKQKKPNKQQQKKRNKISKLHLAIDDKTTFSPCILFLHSTVWDNKT